MAVGRRIRSWLGIAAICATILFIPVWSGASKAAQEAYDPGAFFGLPLPALKNPLPVTERNDKDCIGHFSSRREAQRFFLDNRPKADPHRLDSDRDGRACEEYDYSR